jgi:glycosyltransferase involved in cell wall biosynthesis
VVLATGQPGIRDVFADGDNGYQLTGTTPGDIARGLARIVGGSVGLRKMAMHNRRLAEEQYRASTSMARISRIIEQAVSS